MAAIGGRTPSGKRGHATGVCPVCRSRQRLLAETGKIVKHGKTAAAPSGCAGSYEPPLRTDPAPGGRGTVVGFRAGDSGPTAQGGPEVRSNLPPPPAAG